jgi:hypothetical protein
MTTPPRLLPFYITHGDGSVEEVPRNVCQAFAELERGGASGNQQLLALQWIFRLTQPMGIASGKASEREAGMADGARLVGQQIARLIGGEHPWKLKQLHLGLGDDDAGSKY